jgi:double-stranded uracil-DNA glycosylase
VGVKFGLPPVARDDARLFILGSLPGDVSLSEQRYYAHPTNQFWRLLGAAINQELEPLSYSDRLDCLAERGIGLWDVLASATRSGSLDQAIRAAEHNRIEHLLGDFPDIRAIAFNGSTASIAGRKQLLDRPITISLIDLPSSSAANTRPLDDKARAWALLRNFVRP